jgi:hypothetical protein
MYDLPPYVDRCAWIRLETLPRRRSDACVIFVFDVLSGRVGSPYLLSLVNLVAPRCRTRGGDFLRIDFHRTNYGPWMMRFSTLMRLLVCLIFICQGINFLINCLRSVLWLYWIILFAFPWPFIRGTGRFSSVVSIYLRFQSHYILVRFFR